MSNALLLDGVSKSYASHHAVKNLSLSVPTGTIYGILGPNGAGKSTTLRMVMNIIIRDAGTISLLGADPERDRTVLQRVGYLPEERGLYKKMTVIDVITFFAELKGVERKTAISEGTTRSKPRISYGEGDTVRVTEGPFANFAGVVVEVKPEKQKLRVNLSIFGRATPVELDFAQVEKA